MMNHMRLRKYQDNDDYDADDDGDDHYDFDTGSSLWLICLVLYPVLFPVQQGLV